MKQWPAAVLFDFDGVIVDSEPLHLRAFQQTLAARKIPLTDEDYYRELIGYDDRGAFRHWFARLGIDLTASDLQSLLADKSRIMSTLMSTGEFSPLPGARELIEHLSGRIPLAICSGALRHEIETMLVGIGLRERFPVIVSAEDVAISKPDPQGYLLTLSHLSEKIGRTRAPADALIIEDAPTVIRSVRAVGFPVLGVASSHSIEDLAQATWAVPSLEPAVLRKTIPELYSL